MECGKTCHECGRYSYNGDQPSYLYLLTNQDLQLYKIGIGTVDKDKDYLKHLVESGWRVYGLWHDADKRETFKWEREIFKKLEARIVEAEEGSLGFVGRRDRDWVESISASVISERALADLISAVVSGKVK